MAGELLSSSGEYDDGAIVYSPAEYRERFAAGLPIVIPEESDLRLRILRGADEEALSHLGPAGRLVVFNFGPDAAQALADCDRAPMTCLGIAGLMPDYIAMRRAKGDRFRMVVYRGGEEAPLATWDNALDMVRHYYAEVAPGVVADIEAHRAALKMTPFAIFAGQVGRDLDVIEVNGPDDPDYMTTERYMAIPQAIRDGNPLYLRRWLYHYPHYGKLYTGTGKTQLPDGSEGMNEYLVPNIRVASLPDVADYDFTFSD